MPNIASLLRDEISRLTRREVRRGSAALKKASAAYRSDIAALKRRVAELEARLKRLEKGARTALAASANGRAAQGTRFSARSMAAQRRRLGLSAAECGLLVGASAQSIYNWEEGKTRPRAQHLPAIFALRTIGRREAAAHLESLKKAA